MQPSALPQPIAFVLGGGSLGAVQVGMLRTLAEQGLVPDLVAGTSVGALNGAVVALDPSTAAERLSQIWPTVTRQMVFPGGPRPAALRRRGRRQRPDDAGADRGGRHARRARCGLPGPASRRARDARRGAALHRDRHDAGPSHPGGSARRAPGARRLPAGPPIHRISPLEFDHTDMLIEGAYRTASAFLAELDVDGPGLYGSPSGR